MGFKGLEFTGFGVKGFRVYCYIQTWAFPNEQRPQNYILWGTPQNGTLVLGRLSACARFPSSAVLQIARARE